MRAVLYAAAVLVACSGRGFTLYQGQGTAHVDVVGHPTESWTRSEPDEQAKVRALPDGRIEVQLDECSFTTEPAFVGRAAIPPGTACGADRGATAAEIRIHLGEVVLDEAEGTVYLRIEGRGRAARFDEHLDMRYTYSFTGARR